MSNSRISSSLAINHDDELIIQDIKSILDHLKEIGLRKNIDIKTYCDNSLGTYLSLDTLTKKEINKNLRQYTNTLDLVPSFKKNQPIKRSDDIDCLKYALEEFGFKTYDDDYSFIGKKDFIEIYNIEGIQLWRNLELLRINVYDLLTILTNEWFKLYERSKIITDSMHNRIQELYSSDIKTAIHMQIAPHTLKATALEETVVVGVEFKYFKPVFHKKTGKKVAFILTGQSTDYLLTDDDATNLSHI